MFIDIVLLKIYKLKIKIEQLKMNFQKDLNKWLNCKYLVSSDNETNNVARCDQPHDMKTNNSASENCCDQTRDLQTNNYQRHQVAAAVSLTLAITAITKPTGQ